MTCRHYFLELVNCHGVPCVYAMLSGCNSTDKDRRDNVDEYIKVVCKDSLLPTRTDQKGGSEL